MFRIHKLLLFLILLATPGEAHCPANRIVADATKRRNDTAERARLAAGAERRRTRRAVSYAEDGKSDEDRESDGTDEYQTPKKQRNKIAYDKRKKDAKASGGEVSRKRKPAATAAKKDPVSKKRGRPASHPELGAGVSVEESSVTASKRRGRKPQIKVIVEAEKAAIAQESVVAEENSVIVANSNTNVNDIECLQLDDLSIITPQRTRRKPNLVIYRESTVEETVEDQSNEWKTAKQDFEERYKVKEGMPRPSAARVRKHRDNGEEESDSDDSSDDMPSPQNLPACRLGDIEECSFCSAEHYPNEHVCCDNGAVFIKPMRRLPQEMFNLLFGKGVNAKLFRARILSYNNAFAFASVQYNRIPAAAHGVQSVKVQGNPGHFPSCALPFGNNDPLYGNVYLYCGDKAVDIRMNAYNQLNKEVVRILENCMARDNCWAQYYRNLGEIIGEEDRKAPGSGDCVRMKIINANQVDKQELQAHKGVYRKVLQGGDHVALFFQATVEQDVKMPGLIIYPKRGANPILPLLAWDPKATSLCYPIFCPYGEYVFGHQMYPLMKGDDKKLSFKERLIKFAREDVEAAKLWEVELDAETLVGEAAPVNNVEEELDDVEMIEGNFYGGEGESEDETEEVFYDALMAPVDEERGIEEQSAVVDVPVEEPRKEIELDMDYRQNEMDFDNIIQPEQYPIQEDEWTEQNESSRSLPPRGEAGDFPFDLLPSTNEEPVEQEQTPVEDLNDDEDNEKEKEAATKRGSRVYSSLKHFVTYIYQRRPLVQNRFLRGEKLGQLFLIDHYMRMLNQRYSFIRDKCGEYLTSTKNKMLKARQRLADKLHLGITIGAQFSVPHTVPGSPRWLQQKFENAVAMCNAFGRPDLFITATCNVKWPEIKERIPAGETWTDHPFLVNEVFKKKLDLLMEMLNGKGVDRRTKRKKKGLFGRVCWFTYSIEFQQRGPPHAHILISLKRKPKNVLQIDKLCQAVLPKDNPDLRKLVEDFMIHSPCEGDPTAYCRAGLNPSKFQCSKGYPKCFNDTTKMGDRYYPELERPCDGEHCAKNKKADNRYVVPYSVQLLSFWEGHINFEVISVLSVVKYIFKYLFKGFDRALVEIATGTDSLDKNAMTIDGHLLLPNNVKIPEGTLKKRREEAKKLLRTRGIPLMDKSGKPTVVFNEFWVVEDMRAVTSCEAAWEFAGYSRHSASHTVIESSIHAEDEERLVYTAEEQEELGGRLAEEELRTKLKAWFDLNERDPAANDYTFEELPMGYIYSKGQWRPRKRKIKNLVTRIKSVTPRYRELYAIRLLCSNLKGIKSFADLRTVDDVVYKTAVEAAYARTLD